MERREFLKGTFGLIAASAMAPSDIFAKQDIFLKKQDFENMKNISKKFSNISKHIGSGYFNIISFDEALKISKNFSDVGEFSKQELDLIEKMFYENPSVYGFYGRRTVSSLTQTINKKDVFKVPHTGHYLYKGKSEKTYQQVLKDIGNSLTLTSGVRSVTKQMNLYFNKIIYCKGNVSQACYSLAPAGYSYHSISDFDVGKKGWGSKNFSPSFALTDEFKELTKLKYIDIRYTINNSDGVRFEPWHIKVT